MQVGHQLYYSWQRFSTYKIDLSDHVDWTLQQAVDQDDSLNDDQKQQKKHKIEKDIAAGVITAGLGYAVIYKMPPKETREFTTVYFVLFYFNFWGFICLRTKLEIVMTWTSFCELIK